jgi:hypothetical protein
MAHSWRAENEFGIVLRSDIDEHAMLVIVLRGRIFSRIMRKQHGRMID